MKNSSEDLLSPSQPLALQWNVWRAPLHIWPRGCSRAWRWTCVPQCDLIPSTVYYQDPKHNKLPLVYFFEHSHPDWLTGWLIGWLAGWLLEQNRMLSCCKTAVAIQTPFTRVWPRVRCDSRARGPPSPLLPALWWVAPRSTCWTSAASSRSCLDTRSTPSWRWGNALKHARYCPLAFVGWGGEGGCWNKPLPLWCHKGHW